MERSTLRACHDRIEADLYDNILPFWLQHGVDRERGGFVGLLTTDLKVDPDASRGALLTSRILWTFSAVHRRRPDPAYREMADRAFADLTSRFLDREHGGYFWAISAVGEPANTRKQLYGQAFAIYALAECHRASGRRDALDAAIALHRLVEEHCRDRVQGGYFEAFARDWQRLDEMRLSAVDQSEPKSQNAHLHLMEAYTNLLRIWPDAELRRAQTDLVEIMLTRILDPATHHLGLFFSEKWEPRSERFSYGHDIEAAWLLTEAGEVLDDLEFRSRIAPAAVRIAQVTLAEGLDTDGAVLNEGSPSGLTNTSKEWWPQAEAVVGFLNAFQLSGDERFLEAALRCWDFIEARLIDQQRGEWFRGVTREGAVLPDHAKISFWKCPYHNGRAALEATARLGTIMAAMPT